MLSFIQPRAILTKKYFSNKDNNINFAAISCFIEILQSNANTVIGNIYNVTQILVKYWFTSKIFPMRPPTLYNYWLCTGNIANKTPVFKKYLFYIRNAFYETSLLHQ